MLDQLMKSTFKDERQMEFSLFPIMGMITWIFWELSFVSKENLLTCPTSLAGSLLLDNGYLGSMF